MTEYIPNEKALASYDSFEGATVYRYLHGCRFCDNPILSQFTPGTCYDCGPKNLDIDPVDSVSAFSLYIPKNERGSESGDILRELESFSREITDAKSGRYKEKMSEILSVCTIMNDLGKYDLLVVPPSSSSGINHMTPIAELVSDQIDIPFSDIIRKTANIPPMKQIGDLKERRQKARGSYNCNKSLENSRVIILDDIATSCATLIGTAEALASAGAEQIAGVTVARNVDMYALKKQELILPND